MREIKFRSWCTITKRIFCCESLIELLNEAWDTGSASGLEREESEYSHLIWMQFTGLKDKNGVETYEGDIVLHQKNKKVVCWDDKHLCHVLIWADKYSEVVNDDGSVSNGGQGYTYKKVTANLKCEVIGNIYENPEILNIK